MVAELLSTGIEKAITGKELAAFFGCGIRAITEQIARERRDGQPICASPNKDYPGYYLAANADELQAYCDRLQHRAAEIDATRQALLDIIRQYAAAKRDIGGLECGKH